MNNPILNSILYNYRLKNLVNRFIDSPLLTQSPIYQYFYHQKINSVIKKYSRLPFSLRIENTNYCNARCFMCPHSSMKRPQGTMDRTLYKTIIDQAVDAKIEFINLHNFGEPLIDNDFVWKVEYAKSKGIKRISTNTNAQLLTAQLSSKLINSGLDELFISLDAASEDTYKKIRIGLNYQTVLDNVSKMIKLKKALNRTKPLIIVDFLQSSLNEHETKKFISQWQNQADRVCISKLHDWSSKKTDLIAAHFKNYVSFSHAPCRLPFTEMTINWDGSVVLCCQDIDNEIILGNVKDESILSIWTGSKLDQIKQKHLKLDTGKLPLCRNCKLRTFWWTF